MGKPSPFFVSFNEDSSATILGRITARNGTGAATGIDGEGNYLKQADISSITLDVFDLDGTTPTTPVESTLTVSTVVLDTPITTNVIWTADTKGYNFIHDLAATVFSAGGNRYRLEYKVTLTGGEVFFGVYNGIAKAISGS